MHATSLSRFVSLLHRAIVRPVLRARVLPMLAVASLLLMAATRVQAEAKRPTVVFYAPAELDADIRATLEDALVTQLLPLPVDLQFEVRGDVGAGGIEQHRDMVKRVVVERGAVAVFWLEVRTGRWFLYAVDSHVERVVLRPLTANSESQEAAVESVALIARATTDAVLRGEPLPEDTEASNVAMKAGTSGPTPPPWPVEHTGEPHAGLRLAASYVGTTFSRGLNWQSGFGLRADWVWGAGPYAGIGYTFFGTATFDDPSVRFAVDRYPFSLHAGLRFGVHDFTFSAELGTEIEVRTRRTLSVNMLSSSAALEAQPEVKRTVYSVCPKLESEYTITPWLRVFGGIGLDFVLANFPYALTNTETKETIVVVDPHWLRLTVQAGIGIVR